MKTAVVLIEGRAFALFFHPHHGAFGSLCSSLQEFAIQGKKRVKRRGLTWVQLDFTDPGAFN